MVPRAGSGNLVMVLAAGWYADPVTVGAARYWDGRGWTDLVSWGASTQRDPTPIAEVERRQAASEAAVIDSYLADARGRGLVSREVILELHNDLARRARSPVASADSSPPRRPIPPVVPPPSTLSELPPPPVSSRRVPSPSTSGGLPPPPSGGLPPPPTRAGLLPRPQASVGPAPRPVPSRSVEPIRVEPGLLARWWSRAQEEVRSDLALHGLAYLGVLLMFAGVAGLIIFSFGDIRPGLRTATELLVPSTLLVAGTYLGRRGASVVSAALIVLGAALVPLVAVASLTDNAPLPPDATGRALPALQGALCVVIAAVMVALVRRSDGSTPLRYLCAPVIWMGALLFAAIFRDAVPQGYDTARPDAFQLAAVLAVVTVTVLLAQRWGSGDRLAAATIATALPVAGSVYVVELVLAGNEGWPVPTTLVSGFSVLVLLDVLARRLPAVAVTAGQVAVVAITGARLAVHTPPEWSAACTALALLLLVEYAGWRRPDTTAAWIGLATAGAALLLSAPVAAPGAVAFGVTTAWALWRYIAPPAWLAEVDRYGIVAAASATVTTVELWRMSGTSTALVITALVVLGVAIAGRVWDRVGADPLWQWFTPASAVAVTLASVAHPWGEVPGPAAASAAMALAAFLLSVVPAEVKTWTAAAMATWSLANLAESLEIGLDTQAIAFATAALGVVCIALWWRWSISHHLALIGHTAGVGALFVATSSGWTLTYAVMAATLGWIATSAVNELSGAAHVGWARAQAEAEPAQWKSWADDIPVLVSIGGSAASALLATDAAGAIEYDDVWAGAVTGAVAVVAAAVVRWSQWRLANPVVLAWATLALSLGSIYAVGLASDDNVGWPLITSLGLGIAVVVVARAPRPAVFAWVGWAESAGLAVVLAERAGLQEPWVVAALIGWGAVALLASLVKDRIAHGPAPTRTFVRQPNLLAPASLGIVAMVVGSIWGLVSGTEQEIGYMSAGLALVAFATALMLTLGSLGGVAEALATLSFLLLAPWEPVEHPWSMLPLVAAALAVAWMTRSRPAEPFEARWDLPSFIVAHGIAVLALIAAVEYDSVPVTFLGVGVLSLVVSALVRRWAWFVAGAVLVLIAATDAGPGWLALALLIEGIALTTLGLRTWSRTRWILLSAGAVALVGAWFELADWQSWSIPTVMYATVPGAAVVSVAAALSLRVRRVADELAVIWTVAGAATALFAMPLVTDSDVSRRPGGLTVGGGLVLLSLAAGIGAETLGRTLRWIAACILAVAWVPIAWAIDPTTTTITVGATAVALGTFALILAFEAAVPSSPWIGPASLFAGLTQLGGLVAALSALPDSNLLIVVLLAAAGELIAVGLVAREPVLFVASPAAACAAWVVYAADALSGEPNWFTMPIGVTLLVMIGLVRWIRRSRGGQVAGHDVVVLELIAMVFTVASPLAQTLAGQLWHAVLAVGIGFALAGWGLVTRVRRRVGFGAGTVVVAVLFLIAVPLADLAPWRGPALWITVIAIGLAAVLVATSIERGRHRLQQIKRHLDEMTDGWERIGYPAPPASPVPTSEVST